MRVVVLTLVFLVSALPAALTAAQREYPATATIRGENIWLRVDPAEDTAIVAYLQRGDQVRVTADATPADGDAFYPVEVVATGETGWIRDLAIDPRSFAPVSQLPVVEVTALEAEDERPARNQNRRERSEAETVVVDVPTQTNDSGANANPPAAVQVLDDRDCGDFGSQAEAQQFFESQGGPSSDPHDLDRERDGIACESLP
jgi:Excalibur calcium-binding domain